MMIVSRLLVIVVFMLGLSACVTDVENSVGHEPDFARASQLNVRLGLDYLQKQQMAMAKQKLLLALKQDPNSDTAHSAMGYYLERTGDIEQAETHYKKAIALATIKGTAENNYGTFLCRQKRYQEADYYFQQAAVDKQYLTPDKAYVNAGLCALLASDKPKARQYFGQALQKNPRSASALLELARLDYDRGQYAAASEYMRQYMNTATPDAAVLWLAIRIEQRNNDISMAKAYGERLRQNFPNSKEYRSYQQLSISWS